MGTDDASAGAAQPPAVPGADEDVTAAAGEDRSPQEGPPVPATGTGPSPADHYRAPPAASWLPLLWLALVLLLFGIGFAAMILTA